MELKYGVKGCQFLGVVGSNRTFMELKFIIANTNIKNPFLF